MVILLSVMLVYTGTIPLAGSIAIDAILAAVTIGIYSIIFSSVEEIGIDKKYAGSCIGIVSIIAYTPDILMFSLFGSWLDKYGNAGYKNICVCSGSVISAFKILIYTVRYDVNNIKRV